MEKKKIVHVITSLNSGGAEKMLYKLLLYADRDKYEYEVISMTDYSVYGPKIQKLGIKVHALGMKRGIPSFKSLIRARKIVENVDVIQTWMYHADLLGFILYKISNAKKIIWGIRHSNLDFDKNKKNTLLVAKVNAFLSRRVDSIVSCSIKAKQVHAEWGYDEKRIVVIPNGFEIDSYKKSSEARQKIIKEFNFEKETKIICHIASWKKLKDHNNFLKAMSILKKSERNFKLLLCGLFINNKNNDLNNLIKKYGLQKEVYLLDVRGDIQNILAGSDLFISSSSGEGFPNVIGEAMACEVPCVVTDVGDSAYIVGDFGTVVPKKDSDKLAEAALIMLNTSRDSLLDLGKGARKRVIENFDIKKIAKQYEELYT